VSEGRRIEADPVLPSQQDRTRRYRTRQDAFVEVWREELVPMLQTIPHLRATTILSELQRRHPSRYPIGCCARCSGASRTGGQVMPAGQRYALPDSPARLAIEAIISRRVGPVPGR
jgi:hypothetical protein